MDFGAILFTIILGAKFIGFAFAVYKIDQIKSKDMRALGFAIFTLAIML